MLLTAVWFLKDELIVANFWRSYEMEKLLCKLCRGWDHSREGFTSPFTATPLLDKYFEELKAGVQTNHCTWMFVAALFTPARRWKRSQGHSMDD